MADAMWLLGVLIVLSVAISFGLFSMLKEFLAQGNRGRRVGHGDGELNAINFTVFLMVFIADLAVTYGAYDLIQFLSDL